MPCCAARLASQNSGACAAIESEAPAAAIDRRLRRSRFMGFLGLELEHVPHGHGLLSVAVLVRAVPQGERGERARTGLQRELAFEARRELAHEHDVPEA